MDHAISVRSGTVRAAIDRVTEPAYRPLFEGRRLGLVSNMSGLSVVHGWRSTVDVLHRLYDVRVLFAPEHGTRGVLGPGERVAGGRDELTGLWSYSLFEDMVFALDADKSAEARAKARANDRAYMPAADTLRGLDLLVFDMQDVGSRYFTYASTLLYTMRACAAHGLPLCVLDRPNPLGGEVVEGARQEESCTSFIGLGRAPIRHGLTMGELARYYGAAYGIGCDLTVIPCAGLDRAMLWADTGLPFVRPSPNLPSPDAVTVYNGTCMLAGTNVSEGRGTTLPFTMIGAPYIHPERLADAMNDRRLPGLMFSPAFFRPDYGKYAGKVCRGVTLHVTDARAVRAVTMGVCLIDTLRSLFPDDFAFTPPKSGTRWHIDLSTGSPLLREGTLSPEDLLARWDADARAFREETKQFWLYS